MIVYRHPCPHPDIAERQSLLDTSPSIPDGYDAILVGEYSPFIGWSNTDDSKGECKPTEHESRMVQRVATMYATIPTDILERIRQE